MGLMSHGTVVLQFSSRQPSAPLAAGRRGPVTAASRACARRGEGGSGVAVVKTATRERLSFTMSCIGGVFYRVTWQHNLFKSQELCGIH